jgi:hypothetical protein
MYILPFRKIYRIIYTPLLLKLGVAVLIWPALSVRVLRDEAWTDETPYGGFIVGNMGWTE